MYVKEKKGQARGGGEFQFRDIVQFYSYSYFEAIDRDGIRRSISCMGEEKGRANSNAFVP